MGFHRATVQQMDWKGTAVLGARSTVISAAEMRTEAEYARLTIISLTIMHLGLPLSFVRGTTLAAFGLPEQPLPGVLDLR